MLLFLLFEAQVQEFFIVYIISFLC